MPHFILGETSPFKGSFDDLFNVSLSELERKIGRRAELVKDENSTKLRKLLVNELASRTFSMIVPVGNAELNFEMARLTPEKRIEH